METNIKKLGFSSTGGLLKKALPNTNNQSTCHDGPTKVQPRRKPIQSKSSTLENAATSAKAIHTAAEIISKCNTVAVYFM